MKLKTKDSDHTKYIILEFIKLTVLILVIKLITLITKDHNFFLGRIYLMMNLKTRYQTTLKKENI